MNYCVFFFADANPWSVLVALCLTSCLGAQKLRSCPCATYQSNPMWLSLMILTLATCYWSRPIWTSLWLHGPGQTFCRLFPSGCEQWATLQTGHTCIVPPVCTVRPAYNDSSSKELYTNATDLQPYKHMPLSQPSHGKVMSEKNCQWSEFPSHPQEQTHKVEGGLHTHTVTQAHTSPQIGRASCRDRV